MGRASPSQRDDDDRHLPGSCQNDDDEMGDGGISISTPAAGTGEAAGGGGGGCREGRKRSAVVAEGAMVLRRRRWIGMGLMMGAECPDRRR